MSQAVERNKHQVLCIMDPDILTNLHYQWSLHHALCLISSWSPRSRYYMQPTEGGILWGGFFNSQGITHDRPIPEKCNMRKTMCREILCCLPEAIYDKCPHFWDQNRPIHHSNAPMNWSLLVLDYLTKNGSLWFLHLPTLLMYSQLVNIFFPRMKAFLKGSTVLTDIYKFLRNINAI
jgi:hypothetical protein